VKCYIDNSVRLQSCIRNIKTFKVTEHETKLLEKPRVSVTSPPCEVCLPLQGGTLAHSELKQEVAYLCSRVETTMVCEKMVEDELSRVEESATKSTYKLGAGF
jgi:hypothetical protein